MIMMGLKFMDGQPPFKDIYIHGLVRDSHGDKMSKSKGNVLDPIDLIDGIDLESLVAKRTAGMMQPQLAQKIEKLTREEFPDGIPAFGTDALRFTFAAMAATGRDIKFDLSRIEGYRNFCNKLWNAARYVMMNTENQDCGLDGEISLSAADQWILSRLQETIKTVTDAIEGYRFDHMAQAIYDFTWNEYCDWYLELSKTVLNSDTATEAQKKGTRNTLIKVLENLLRLAHPIIPYITEEIWQRAAPLAGVEGETIMLQPYPAHDSSWINQQASDDINWAMQFILGVRRIKAEMNIAPGKPVPVLLSQASAADEARLQSARPYINFLAKTQSIELLEPDAGEPESAIALVGEMKILIPLAGLIDKDAELARLQKEIDKLDKEVKRLNGKLSNANFIDKAPEAVVNKERDKLAEAEKALAHLAEQAEKIKAL
jgi:valyl-tRNA synthetase